MTIQVGDTLPDVAVHIMGANGPEAVQTSELLGSGKVVLFAVPGAFTPGCSNTHMPGFVVRADDILERGVDRIACMSVNDAFVMHAWGENQNASAITMVADGNGAFTRALGLELDASGFGMGGRSQRFAMIIEDGKITHLGVEPGGGVTVSSAESIIDQL